MKRIVFFILLRTFIFCLILLYISTSYGTQNGDMQKQVLSKTDEKNNKVIKTYFKIISPTPSPTPAYTITPEPELEDGEGE